MLLNFVTGATKPKTAQNTIYQDATFVALSVHNPIFYNMEKKEFSNDLRLNISQNDKNNNYKIEIRLNDECRNGHEDFSITATFWQVGKPRIDRYFEIAGCCHDEILQVRPDLAPFVRLHLCDSYGAPMYAAGNGLYYAVPGEFHHKEPGPAALAKYFRITEDQARPLCVAETAAEMAYLIQKHGINAIWEEEAKAAIRLLESLTGETFQSTGTKRQFEPLSPEKYAEIETMDNAGYFTETAVLERAAQKETARIEKKEAELLKRLNGDIEKAKTAYLVDTAIGRLFAYQKDNYIYYNHNSTLDFNWRDCRQNVLFTKEEILAAFDAVRAAGVVCELGKRALAEVNKH